jgi:PHD/YefM family antitoxin component YafN of YafNO toxin-antitoxin module
MRVSSAEFLEIYGALSDKALTEPVITRNGRDRLVLVSAEAFERLSRYAPRARLIEELTDEEVAMIGDARVSAEHDHLNTLLYD